MSDSYLEQSFDVQNSLMAPGPWRHSTKGNYVPNYPEMVG